MKSVLFSFVALLLLMSRIGNAALTNGGFETGDLIGWESVGDASIQTASFGSGPTEGTYQAVLTNSPSVPLSGASAVVQIDDSFLGLPFGSLQAITDEPWPVDHHDAAFQSAIKQTFHSVAGSQLTFSWSYVTNDGYNYDYCFVSLVSSTLVFLEKLAGNDPSAVPGGTNWPPPLVLSNSAFETETGFKTFAYTLPETGSYTLGIGVTGVRDAFLDSGIIIDDVKVTDVPEPFTMLLVGTGLVGLVGLRGTLARTD